MHQILQEHWEKQIGAIPKLTIVDDKTSEESIPKSPLPEVLQDCDLLIPAVPISAFESVIKEVSQHIPANAHLVVADVCSVKMHPAAVMEKYLPKNVGILATHPMWGPDSTQQGKVLSGLRFVHHTIRDNGNPVLQQFIDLWQKLGQTLIDLTPDEHDKRMASSQFYTHLIGRIGEQLDIGATGIDTQGFLQLLEVQNYVVNDTWQLFEDMYKYNPYAREVLEGVLKGLGDLRVGLEDKEVS